MFSRLCAQPLRRGLHTAARSSGSYNRFRMVNNVVGASVLTAGLLTWHLTRERNHIALDSPSNASGPSAASKSSLKRSGPQTNPRPVPEEPPTSDSSASSESDLSLSSPSQSDSTKDDTSSGSQSEGEGSEAPASGGGGGAGGGAFNPETGEINWDCPCLGGMAHGPCGPQFREAFSCFVFSEDEPKGINCVDKFKAMQDCFRAHPEVYADEIMDDDDDEEPVSAPAGNTSPSDIPPSESGTPNDALSQDPAPAHTFHDEKPAADVSSAPSS